MPEKWTGEVVAELHVSRISQKELAAAMGVTVEYVSMLLNGKKSSPGAGKRMMDAIKSIKKEREQNAKAESR